MKIIVPLLPLLPGWGELLNVCRLRVDDGDETAALQAWLSSVAATVITR